VDDVAEMHDECWRRCHCRNVLEDMSRTLVGVVIGLVGRTRRTVALVDVRVGHYGKRKKKRTALLGQRAMQSVVKAIFVHVIQNSGMQNK
jgi:hypothetical protein